MAEPAQFGIRGLDAVAAPQARHVLGKLVRPHETHVTLARHAVGVRQHHVALEPRNAIVPALKHALHLDVQVAAIARVGDR